VWALFDEIAGDCMTLRIRELLFIVLVVGTMGTLGYSGEGQEVPLPVPLAIEG
jgi:hypothetical protein